MNLLGLENIYTQQMMFAKPITESDNIESRQFGFLMNDMLYFSSEVEVKKVSCHFQ